MIYMFSSQLKISKAEVGGKAKALIETTNIGMPVPEGLVLTVAFFKEWLYEIKKSNEWEVMLQDLTKEHCDQVKLLASGKRFSDEQKQLFYGKIQSLNTKVYAVRSSSPEEDLEGTSYAGQYETYLGIHSDQLEINIAKAFSSCFDYRVIEYKRNNYMALDDSSIAIIVQRQVSSHVSGVGFSINPLNNCYDEVVINASFGLGEAVVSGLVNPDTYIVDGVEKKIIHKQIKDKHYTLWIGKDGGIEEKYENKSDVQALSDQHILALTDLIKDCEKYYQKPVDIEWAIEDGKLFLLQVRPITTYLPLFPEMLTEPGERKKLYLDHIVISQGLQDSMSVLGLNLWGPLVEKLELGIFPVGLDGLMHNVHGRQYINISNMLAVMGTKLTTTLLGEYNQSVKRTLEQLALKDDYKSKEKTKLMKKSRNGLLRVSYMSIQGLFHATVHVDKFADKCNSLNENTFNLLKTEVEKYFDTYKSIVKTLRYSEEILFETMVDQQAMVAAMYAKSILKKMFKNSNLDDEIAALGMDVHNNPTEMMADEMRILAAHQEFQEINSFACYKEKILKRNFNESFLKAYDRFMYRYGSRGFGEIDIANMRNDENHENFYMLMKMIDISGEIESALIEKRQKYYGKLLTEAKNKRKVRKFKKYADWYQKLFGYREWPKYLLTVYVDSVRSIALSIGELWFKQGRIDDIQDIFYLHAEEIDLGLVKKKLDIRKLIYKNRIQYERVEKVKQWPMIIDSRGKIFVEKRLSENGDYIGDGVSAGLVRGKAKVMSTPFEKILEQGEILVTRATEPSWTPIFIKSSGIVLEIGSTLQHGAIIAREYGLPCVCGVVNATNIIKDGDMIEVDGNNGIVRIIDENDFKYRAD